MDISLLRPQHLHSKEFVMLVINTYYYKKQTNILFLSRSLWVSLPWHSIKRNKGDSNRKLLVHILYLECHLLCLLLHPVSAELVECGLLLKCGSIRKIRMCFGIDLLRRVYTMVRIQMWGINQNLACHDQSLSDKYVTESLLQRTQEQPTRSTEYLPPYSPKARSQPVSLGSGSSFLLHPAYLPWLKNPLLSIVWVTGWHFKEQSYPLIGWVWVANRENKHNRVWNK